MSDQPKNPIVSGADAPGFPMTPEGGSEVFGAMLQPIGALIGARKIGVMRTTVEPGKRAFPFHNHHANEELFVILEGAGAYRFGEKTHAVKAGDVCAAPAGGPETAHQLINTGDAPLVYLAISTMLDPEVCEYPDSGKFATISVGEGRDFNSARVRHVARAETSLDYWDGEPMSTRDAK